MRLILSCDGLRDQIIQTVDEVFFDIRQYLELAKVSIEKWKGMFSFLKEKHILHVNSEVYCEI